MKYKSFIKNTKALSPIFATLILIAIAVIAGIVVYMFTSGTLASMTGGGTAGQEKVTVQTAYYDADTDEIVVIAQSTGGPAPVVNGIIIKDASGNTNQTISLSASVELTNALKEIRGTPTALEGSYTATLTTTAGGSFVSPSFTV